MPRDSDELVALLDLETIDDNLFRGAVSQTELPRVFGGQVAAQALVGANRTVDPAYAVHSLHSYFLQPGDTETPIIYDVENLRDGRSFATRRVLARQHGRPIYAMTANFQKAEDGFEHQDAMPDVPAPEDCEDPRVSQPGRPGTSEEEWAGAEMRYVGSSADGRLPDDPAHPGRQRVWLRASSALPDDPLQHLAAFTYLSDMTLMSAALAAHDRLFGDPEIMLASLDHAIWFHRPFRVDEWWLYDQVSPSASGGRGLVTGSIFTRDGLLAATVAQEFLMRPIDPARRSS